MSRLASLALATLMSVSITGCAQMIGQLRMDLNDDQAAMGPTTGGTYPEAGYLDDLRDSPGHFDRSPSSQRADREEKRWASEDDRRGRDSDDDRFDSEQEQDEDSRPRDTAPRARPRVTRNDFIDQAADSGSLWASAGESNFFFSKNRARSPGDIISIAVESEMLRDISAEIKRTLTPSERRREIEILESRQQVAAAGKPGTGGAAPTAPAGSDQLASSSAAPEPADSSFASVDVTPQLGIKAGDEILAEVVERFPNGNYKIRGSKRVRYRNSTKMMTFVGIMRGNDLTTDEKIPSGKIYEYRLQVVR